MNSTNQSHGAKRRSASLFTALLLASGGTLVSCGSKSEPTAKEAPSTTAGSSTANVANTSVTTDPTTAPRPADSSTLTTVRTGGPVLPVADNPISNASTVQALKIVSVLVENNVDSSGKAAPDHLEIALSNTGTTKLTAFETFYTFTDTATGVTENYYAKLPADFTIAPDGSRTAHFDNTGAADHFPVNQFSLYYTDTNALDVSVIVSANDSALQTANVQKDAGGPETAD